MDLHQTVTVAADALRLCGNGIGMVSNNTLLGCPILFGPCASAARIDYGTGLNITNPRRCAARALGGLVAGNPTLRTIAGTSPRPIVTGPFQSSAMTVSSGEFTAAPADGFDGFVVWRNTAAAEGAMVGGWGGKHRTLSVSMRHTAGPNRSGVSAPIHKFYPQGQRSSQGIPDRGIFPSLGEVIADLSGSTNGWKVTTAGCLAKAFTSGETGVHNGALCTNGGNVYQLRIATATATLGATAPTGTSLTADVSDGTNNWRYIGPVAVLTAA